MRAELAPLGPEVFADYERFVAYSRDQYDVVERGYLRNGFDSFWQFMRFYGLKDARTMDWSHSMTDAIHKRVRDPYLRDIFGYFIKYVGSSRKRFSGVHEPDAEHPA